MFSFLPERWRSKKGVNDQLIEQLRHTMESFGSWVVYFRNTVEARRVSDLQGLPLLLLLNCGTELLKAHLSFSEIIDGYIEALNEWEPDNS